MEEDQLQEKYKKNIVYICLSVVWKAEIDHYNLEILQQVCIAYMVAWIKENDPGQVEKVKALVLPCDTMYWLFAHFCKSQ